MSLPNPTFYKTVKIKDEESFYLIWIIYYNEKQLDLAVSMSLG